MQIREIAGSLKNITINDQVLDWLDLEWYETSKRILRKHTRGGKELQLKFLNNHKPLAQDDVLFEDNAIVVAVNIVPCDAVVIAPASMHEMAAICYEIGNKHLPLYFENDQLLVPFEMPLYRLLTAQGYNVMQEKRKLLQPFNTTVAPHGNHNASLFSRIMQLTNSSA